MVDDLGLGSINVGNVVSSGVDSFVTVILWLTIIIAVIAIIILAWYFMSFKHRIRIRKIVKGRVIIIDDKAKEYKSKDGDLWWKFLKTKIKVTAPPEEAIEIGRKGKLICEGFLLKDNQFVWRIDVSDEKDLINAVNAVKGDHKLFTSQERALYAKELRDSEQYKKKKISDLLAIAAPYIAIIMIFALFLIFFNEVVTPAKELGTSIKESVALQRETMIIVRDIVQNRETMLLENITVPN